MIHGYMYTLKPDISPYDNTYYKNELDELKKGKDFMKELEKYQAPIEYIDSLESEYLFIAKDYRSIDKQYTHCEIEPSLILSAVTLNIPFRSIHKPPEMCFQVNKRNKPSVYILALTTLGSIHLDIFIIIPKNLLLPPDIKNIPMSISYRMGVIVLWQ